MWVHLLVMPLNKDFNNETQSVFTPELKTFVVTSCLEKTIVVLNGVSYHLLSTNDKVKLFKMSATNYSSFGHCENWV